MLTQTKRISISIAALIVLLGIGFYSVGQYIERANKETVTRLESAITAQEIKLATVAELTRSNGADAITDRFVVDCKSASRQRFDTLLDLLSKTITQSELTELTSLFYVCGSYYADRKSIMAIKLAQEVEHLESLHTVQSAIAAVPERSLATLALWNEIAAAELKTAEYFNTLVDLQESIIADLKLGKKSDSSELNATLTEVNSVRGQMLVLSKQIEVNKQQLQ